MGMSVGASVSTNVSSAQEVKVLKAAQKQDAVVTSKLLESVNTAPPPRSGDTGRRVNVQA